MSQQTEDTASNEQSNFLADVFARLDAVVPGSSPRKFDLRLSQREWGIAGIAAAIVLVLTLVLLKILGVNVGTSLSGQSFTQITSGTVALTEQELRDATKQLGVPVYWVGPQERALYTLDSRVNGQVFVRYLPDGNGAEDTQPNYRVIATYTMKDAYKSTQDAGTLDGGLGFTNSDGAAVYYSKSTPTNVYVAFPSKDVQIEIYDPNSGQALQLATSPGQVQMVN